MVMAFVARKLAVAQEASGTDSALAKAVQASRRRQHRGVHLLVIGIEVSQVAAWQVTPPATPVCSFSEVPCVGHSGSPGRVIQ
jgi:hypothetical protein